MNEITSNQNEPELKKLLRASSVAYSKAKRGENNITYFLIFLAFAYPIAYTLILDETFKIILFGCSFLLAILVEIFFDSFKGNTSLGAIFKEEFDTKLFDLPWKSTIKKPDYSIVSKYSIQYKGKDIADWYSCNLMPIIPHNSSIAILQHTNTSWDIELRKSYRIWLIGCLTVYSILLFSYFVILKVDGVTIFFVAFSILSFITHIIALIRGHSSAIEKREFISKHLDKLIRNKHAINLSQLRDIQDEIFSTRQESVKVPNFFFRIYQKRMNAITEDYIETVNRLYM